jgi:deoxyribodipyrimidine photo-lyase
MLGLVWFREDLRTQDNLALFHAAKSCARGVVGIYIIDASAWQSHHMAACRIEFLLRGVVELSIELAKLHIPLMVAEVKSTADISALLLKKINEIHAQGLFFNRQYEVNEKKRDAAVEKYLSQHDIKCYSYDDPVILPPGSLATRVPCGTNTIIIAL